MTAAAPHPPSSPHPTPTGALDGLSVAIMGLLCLLWSLQQISLKAVSEQVSPMLMVALRSLIAIGLLVLTMHRRGERAQRSRWRAGSMAGTLFALEYLLVSQALNLTQASHVIVFLYTAPIFAALGLHLRLPAERLNRRQWAGIGIAFCGIAASFLGGAGAPETASPSVLWGDGLALLAGVAWGATTVTLRCTSLAHAPATETLLYQLLGAALLLLPAAVLSGAAHVSPSPTFWVHLGFQSLVVSFASFLTWCWLLRRYSAAKLGVFSFLTPLLGIGLGALLLGEPLEARFVAGSALVLAGIGLVSRRATG